MSRYAFLTHWRFKAPINQVWKLIHDTGGTTIWSCAEGAKGWSIFLAMSLRS